MPPVFAWRSLWLRLLVALLSVQKAEADDVGADAAAAAAAAAASVATTGSTAAPKARDESRLDIDVCERLYCCLRA